MRHEQIAIHILLANVLSSTALLACGGQTADDPRPTGRGGDDAGAATPATTLGNPSGPTRVDAAAPSTPDASPPPKSTPTCTTPPAIIRANVNCGDVVYHACGTPKGVDPSDGLTPAECALACPVTTGTKYWGCQEYLADDLPGPSFDCFTCVEGRRPAGYDDATPTPRTVAEWLAYAAELERVSVDAFRILALELELNGAPASLVTAARVAEADEVRHTRMLERFARKAGATLTPRPVHDRPARTLKAVAIENAVEGCVRETFGALVAGHQASTATMGELRLAMKRIYVDETAHAQLAWDVHAWILPQLSEAERAEVKSAMAVAQSDLLASCRHTGTRTKESESMFRALGLPSPAHARAMAMALDRQLFAGEHAA